MARSSKLSIFLTIIVVSVFIVVTFMLLKDLDGPEISLSHAEDTISAALPITVTASDGSSIKYIEVVARFHNNEIPVLRKEFSDDDKTQRVKFTLAGAGLKNHELFELEISAGDRSFGRFGFGNKSKIVIPLRLDLDKPRITVKPGVIRVRRGGSACVVYSVSKDVKQTGVNLGEHFFPAFRQENGDYFCLFAFPYYMEVKDYNPQLVAWDKAGNYTLQNLDVQAIPIQFKTDTIVIRQNFLDAKALEFENLIPGQMSGLERFLAVNGPIRRANVARLVELSKNTAPEFLWRNPFLRLPRAAMRANFAERRAYFWEDKKIDEQTHLGLDLASVKHADVPAANFGTVVFAGYLGIYGNMVVIDHGTCLQSLYSHLSEISVEAGDSVKKGDIIGKTGSTGMAGGDHLHFGILIAGLEVNPQEWLDGHWIRDNIAERVKEAGGKMPSFEVSADTGPARPAPVRPKTPKKAPARGKGGKKR
ncbi:MAG: M23 family metallopeptidase [Desulfovibrio sp.]|jgi:murein DD-endopeptidase MepM/ murein hydrolase activator NlpD|nr:M23 family metallopeptidase [Desulfovibrio sp.]